MTSYANDHALSVPRIAHQLAGLEAEGADGGGPFIVVRVAKHDRVVAIDHQPRILAQLIFQLPRAPAGAAERERKPRRGLIARDRGR